MKYACRCWLCGLTAGTLLLCTPAVLVAEDGPSAPVAKPAAKAEKPAPKASPKGNPFQQAKDNGKPSADDKALDDALLNDLDNELLEGAGNLRRDAKPAKPPIEKGRPAAPKTLEPRDLLDDDMPDKAPPKEDAADKNAAGEDLGEPSAEDDPLAYISQEMRQVERLIPEHARRAHAQQLQDRITENLAKLIEQAENQAAAQQAQKSAKSGQKSQRQSVNQPKNGKPGKDSEQPANDSTERMGKSEQVRPDPAAHQGLLKQAWGNLPDRAREQMLQQPPERFLPQYELMIERYYRRLAEERNGK